jgi:hypothetical protein
MQRTSKPHEYTISFPRTTAKPTTPSSSPPHHHHNPLSFFRTFKYCPATGKVCLPDVLMLLGREPKDYMEAFKNREKDLAMLQEWQEKWPSITEQARRMHHNPVCSVCATPLLKTHRCAGCLKFRVEVLFCSTECRDAGWPEHKRVCLKKAAPSTLADLKRVTGEVVRIKRALIMSGDGSV